MEEFRMARQSKREYLRSIHERYRRAQRAEKTAMLEEFCKVCGYNRKYAIWLLKRPLSQPKAHRRRTQRSVTYSQAAITMLAKVWEASGYLCSQRLKAALPQWLPWAKKHFDISIEQRLPFRLRGIDSDNGSEFINAHLFNFCQQRPKDQTVQFTRSRPYKKDDNAHVEQKNWTHVRKLLGWQRYDTAEALQRINSLYEKLRIFQNLFQPSVKLSRKIRKGSRVMRRYEQPATPLERVLHCAKKTPQIQALQFMAKNTDPFELSRQIDQQLDGLYNLKAQHNPLRVRIPLTEPKLVPDKLSLQRPKIGSAWRHWAFTKKQKRQLYEMQRQIRTQPSVRFSHDSTNTSPG